MLLLLLLTLTSSPRRRWCRCYSYISHCKSIACQEIVNVNAQGVFETAVAVSNDFSSWSVVLTMCTESAKVNAKDKDKASGHSQCRMVNVEPPGAAPAVADAYCHPVAVRVTVPPTEQDYTDKTHYMAKVDFRRCAVRNSDNSKQRQLKLRRVRRNAVCNYCNVRRTQDVRTICSNLIIIYPVTPKRRFYTTL